MEPQKTILITGASRGIGKAAALRFAKEGFRVVLCARGEAALMQARDDVLALGAPCLAVRADVGDPADCRRLFDACLDAFGPPEFLINNAAVSHIGLLQDMTDSQWDSLLRTNLSSLFYCCRLAIPHMIRRGRGRILNVSSVWGAAGASCETAYSASKGGVNAFTRALAKELAPSGIQVNALACGVIDTEMNGFLDDEERAALTEEIPAGRMGTPEEAADTAFRIMTASPYLTGQVITLDGGWQ